MNYDLELVKITPSEAAAISGLSTVMQRDWRRRGILPASDKHKRFDMFEVAELWIYKMMSDRGIGPLAVKELSEWLVSGIMWNALLFRDAYDGDEESLAVEPDDVEVLELLEQVKEKIHIPEFGSVNWTTKVDHFRRGAFSESGHLKRTGRVIPARFFLWFPDGEHTWQESIDDCFLNNNDYDTNGPVLVLDQLALGETLVRKCNRPMIIVSKSTDENE